LDAIIDLEYGLVQLSEMVLSHIGAAQMQSLLAPALAKGRGCWPPTNPVRHGGERAAARRTVSVFDIDQMASQGVAQIGLEHAETDAVVGGTMPDIRP